MRPLFHLWSANRMKGSSVQLNSVRRTFFVICSHQKPNDHTNSGPGHMIMFSLSRMLKLCPALPIPALDESLTLQTLQNINILLYLISLIFCLTLQMSLAVMRSVVPRFLNKRRCDDELSGTLVLATRVRFPYGMLTRENPLRLTNPPTR